MEMQYNMLEASILDLKFGVYFVQHPKTNVYKYKIESSIPPRTHKMKFE